LPGRLESGRFRDAFAVLEDRSAQFTLLTIDMSGFGGCESILILRLVEMLNDM
jgi:hypothetical protein